MSYLRKFKCENDKIILDRVSVERNIQYKTVEGYYNSVSLFESNFLLELFKSISIFKSLLLILSL